MLTEKTIQKFKSMVLEEDIIAVKINDAEDINALEAYMKAPYSPYGLLSEGILKYTNDDVNERYKDIMMCDNFIGLCRPSSAWWNFTNVFGNERLSIKLENINNSIVAVYRYMDKGEVLASKVYPLSNVTSKTEPLHILNMLAGGYGFPYGDRTVIAFWYKENILTYESLTSALEQLRDRKHIRIDGVVWELDLEITPPSITDYKSINIKQKGEYDIVTVDSLSIEGIIGVFDKKISIYNGVVVDIYWEYTDSNNNIIVNKIYRDLEELKKAVKKKQVYFHTQQENIKKINDKFKWIKGSL